MTKFEAVIFDWAGTTVDYGSFAPVQAFIEAFKQYGIEPSTEEVRAPMGMLKRDHIRSMMQMERIHGCWLEQQGKDWTEADVEAVYRLSEKKILELLPGFTDLKPGVIETMEALRKRGIKIGSTTGYTDEMMQTVVPAAAKKGYAPDCWFSPDSTNGKGRPYPYMIFRNMESLGIGDVRKVMKVGDTLSDIREGKHAGVFTVGVIEGSSEMGLTKEAFDALEERKKLAEIRRVEQRYIDAGADAVVHEISGILRFL